MVLQRTVYQDERSPIAVDPDGEPSPIGRSNVETTRFAFGGTPAAHSFPCPRSVAKERDNVLGEGLGYEVDRNVLLTLEEGDADVGQRGGDGLVSALEGVRTV